MRFPKNDGIITSLDTVGWTSWTPTYSSGVGAPTTVTLASAKYKIYGDNLFWFWRGTLTLVGTASADFRITVPSGLGPLNTTSGYGIRNETANIGLQVVVITTHIVLMTVGNAFPLPTNGDVGSAFGNYKVA